MQGAPVEELVLWSVPAHRRTLMRELRAFSALEVAHINDADSPEPEVAGVPLKDGALVANGYLLSAETVAELERLVLKGFPLHPQGARRALLLGRDGLKIDQGLREALEKADATVTVANGPGYGR